jgi:hypothetical protein
MSATIIYSIDSGVAPFQVYLLGTDKPMQLRLSLGTYTFENVICGEYVIRIIDDKDCVFDIPASYPCPATTTTSTTEEPIVTTTTTPVHTTTTTTEEPLEEYPCNYLINYYGYDYEKSISINLGTDLGAVLFNFNFFYIPVKVIIEFDGVEVINTGYRGNPTYQALLDAALTDLGQPTETINPDSQSTLVFTKSSAVAHATMTIYTPIDGAIASLRLRCPVEIVETWTVQYDDYSCIEDEYTATTTEEPVITTTTTTLCYPAGLNYTRNFYHKYDEYTGAPVIDFINSEELACAAQYGFFNEGYNLVDGVSVSADTFFVGYQIYPHDCSLFNGYYIFSGRWGWPTDSFDQGILVRIINNVIVERIVCPVTTTTTVEPATTTTTEESYPIVNCNSSISFPGGESYPTAFSVNLGSTIGKVTFLYQPQGIPDRFIVERSGNVLFDSGYFGSYSIVYAYGTSQRGVFNAALNGKVDPRSGLTYPILGTDLTTYSGMGLNVYPNEIQADGYPDVYDCGGDEYLETCIAKSTTGLYFDLLVYAPMSGTAWNATFMCPQEGECPLITTTTTPA